MFKRRIHFITGKGGVGKSTVASLLALRAAHTGMRVLLIDMDPQGALPLLFGQKSFRTTPKKISSNIDGLLITPKASLREYIIRQVKLKSIYNLIFNNKVFNLFVEAAPGIEEIALMGKIQHLHETISRAKPKWDVLIIDAPATGHGLYLFKVPKVFIDITQTGILAKHSKKIFEMLSQKEITAIHLVTLAEELPVKETIELFGELKKLDLPMGRLFINKLLPHAKEIEATLSEENIGRVLQQKILDVSKKYAIRKTIQHTYKNRLQDALGDKGIEIPWVLDRHLDLSALKTLAKSITIK